MLTTNLSKVLKATGSISGSSISSFFSNPPLNIALNGADAIAKT